MQRVHAQEHCVGSVRDATYKRGDDLSCQECLRVLMGSCAPCGSPSGGERSASFI